MGGLDLIVTLALVAALAIGVFLGWHARGVCIVWGDIFK